MKTKFSKLYTIAIYILAIIFNSCEKFVDVDVPDHLTVSEVVFSDDQTALAAMKGIYNQLFTASFTSGGTRSVTMLAALSADNLKITTSSLESLEFHQNEILIGNTYNNSLWSSMYNIIYMANSVLEGVANSNTLNLNVQNRLLGESKFIRAFSYFYLVNLYGDVPLILSTDYRINAIAVRKNSDDIYTQIIADLENAAEILDNVYIDGERTNINSNVVMAFLARVHLFLHNWESARSLSSQVISQTGTYEILDNLDQVFLANSREAIWQISPIGRGNSLIHTGEGNIFIKTSATNTTTGLSDDFMESWNLEDKRLENWIGSYNDPVTAATYYYPFKYKIQYNNSGGNITEYSMVLRLAEQYLIRAEANLKLGDVSAAISDIDILKHRAGLPLLSNTDPDIGDQELMEIIMMERRKELFAEWGHRWLDLNRYGITKEVLENSKMNWKETSALYPIPEDERLKNPNLGQNPGY